MKFNDYYWHDSIVKNIIIDRTNPGIKDEISFEIEWYEGGTSLITFEGVFHIEMSLNGGIIANESILEADISNEGKVLSEIHPESGRWLDGILLNLYTIKFSSTGGIIKIIAESFRDEPK